jgi:hypothetical protein
MIWVNKVGLKLGDHFSAKLGDGRANELLIPKQRMSG